MQGRSKANNRKWFITKPPRSGLVQHAIELMQQLDIRIIGELELRCGGEKLTLPASKRTRALLGYLVLTGRPQRREKLCDLIWDIPDDPRGALRWSLSKLRQVVNDDSVERLVADRERVTFTHTSCRIDLTQLALLVESPDPTIAALVSGFELMDDEVLAGTDLPDQPGYQSWLLAEREQARKLKARVAACIATHSEALPDVGLQFARIWQELEPFERAAADSLIDAHQRLGHVDDADRLMVHLGDQFRSAGLDWAPKQSGTTVTTTPAPSTLDNSRHFLNRQDIRFCKTDDGVTIAHASVGAGPPLVKAANWLTHLELDWAAPIWSPLFRQLARDHKFIRYDERGNGLSDWDVPEISFEKFVTDLETVVDVLELERFPLLGISQGAAVCIEFAARHPKRVSHLVLFGGYPAGWRFVAKPELIEEREAIITLTKTGWGQDNPAYRHIFSATFMPGATPDQLEWFDDFQRQTTSAENAVRFLSAFGDIDVRHRLGDIKVPTLVLHSRGDRRIPWETGRDIAAAVPGAKLMTLESDNHLLLSDEPASTVFVETVREFLD